jgi:hypothetical protein
MDGPAEGSKDIPVERGIFGSNAGQSAHPAGGRPGRPRSADSSIGFVTPGGIRDFAARSGRFAGEASVTNSARQARAGRTNTALHVQRFFCWTIEGVEIRGNPAAVRSGEPGNMRGVR